MVARAVLEIITYYYHSILISFSNTQITSTPMICFPHVDYQTNIIDFTNDYCSCIGLFVIMSMNLIVQYIPTQKL